MSNVTIGISVVCYDDDNTMMSFQGSNSSRQKRDAGGRKISLLTDKRKHKILVSLSVG